MKTNSPVWTLVIFAALLNLTIGRSRAETAYFLMSGPAPAPANSSVVTESYVIAVSAPALIQQARSYLASGSPLFLVPHLKIALGADATNGNYAEPGHPAWNWHATELIAWTTYDPTLVRAAVYLPNQHTKPSRVVTELLTWKELAPPTDEMTLVYFPLVMELSPDHESTLINIATRGWVGTGERGLIAGFVIQGGAPRNVLIRALGPSLSAFGVTEVLANPSIAVYHGTEKIAANDDWLDGNFIRPPARQTFVAEPAWYEWLFPTNPKDSAIRLSLLPGAYTVQVSGGAGTGIALIEVYDFDALAPH